jgi:hypothetical protein
LPYVYYFLGSTPPPAAERSNSPPIPAVRRSKGGNSSSEFESGSMGFSTASEDDQVFYKKKIYLYLLSYTLLQIDTKLRYLGPNHVKVNWVKKLRILIAKTFFDAIDFYMTG